MTDPDERVVLLADDGEPIGTALKSGVHTTDTPLHLAFSCHVRDAAGRLLVTRRALSKTTWPGVWTNSFCGHPSPGEDLPSAVARRAFDELGVTLTDLRPALPDFRYRAVDAGGIVENEICPVFTAVTLDDVQPDPDEVAEFRWVDAADLETAVRLAPFAFSPWLHLQLVEFVQQDESGSAGRIGPNRPAEALVRRAHGAPRVPRGGSQVPGDPASVTVTSARRKFR